MEPAQAYGSSPPRRNLKLGLTLWTPDHLTAATKAWWLQVARDYGMWDDPVGLAGLTIAGEAWDRKEEARLLIAKQGLEVKDRYGSSVPSRWLRIQVQCMAEFRAAIKALHFDVEPIRPTPGRPPGR
jgi:hypothetical protein